MRGAHFCVVPLRQHRYFNVDVEAMENYLQHSVRFGWRDLNFQPLAHAVAYLRCNIYP